jgi:hypothetical protein
MSPLEELKVNLQIRITNCHDMPAVRETWQARLAAVESLQDQNAKLREALEPFRKRSEELCALRNNRALRIAVSFDGEAVDFTVGDLRRAAQVLAEGGKS